ncbi:hypothetical protein T11_2558 [Trichinella zimbabwensis]|uniref:Uncharacterized protein n=1 Tax=Trichinella zimbabwensis TaxID=268475 RepID=A0A0V1I449_9BILA|nr:hypothetical protein T11_2558 [Trichinella zimbabwensis]
MAPRLPGVLPIRFGRNGAASAEFCFAISPFIAIIRYFVGGALTTAGSLVKPRSTRGCSVEGGTTDLRLLLVKWKLDWNVLHHTSQSLLGERGQPLAKVLLHQLVQSFGEDVPDDVGQAFLAIVLGHFHVTVGKSERTLIGCNLDLLRRGQLELDTLREGAVEQVDQERHHWAVPQRVEIVDHKPNLPRKLWSKLDVGHSRRRDPDDGEVVQGEPHPEEGAVLDVGDAHPAQLLAQHRLNGVLQVHEAVVGYSEDDAGIVGRCERFQTTAASGVDPPSGKKQTAAEAQEPRQALRAWRVESALHLLAGYKADHKGEPGRLSASRSRRKRSLFNL